MFDRCFAEVTWLLFLVTSYLPIVIHHSKELQAWHNTLIHEEGQTVWQQTFCVNQMEHSSKFELEQIDNQVWAMTYDGYIPGTIEYHAFALSSQSNAEFDERRCSVYQWRRKIQDECELGRCEDKLDVMWKWDGLFRWEKWDCKNVILWYFDRFSYLWGLPAMH